MSEERFWEIFASIGLGVLTIGSALLMLFDYGSQQPAYTLDWKHILSWLIVTSAIAWCGYTLGKVDKK